MTMDRKEMIEQIMKLFESVYNSIPLDIPPEWLGSEMTVAQLRVILALQSRGPSRMSSIATEIGVALPTATGFMDKLVRKELAIREKDPMDRRVVICKLSPKGQDLTSKLWTSGNVHMKNLIDGLDEEQLEKVHEVAGILHEKISRKSGSIQRGKIK